MTHPNHNIGVPAAHLEPNVHEAGKEPGGGSGGHVHGRGSNKHLTGTKKNMPKGMGKVDSQTLLQATLGDACACVSGLRACVHDSDIRPPDTSSPEASCTSMPGTHIWMQAHRNEGVEHGHGDTRSRGVGGQGVGSSVSRCIQHSQVLWCRGHGLPNVLHQAPRPIPARAHKP